LIKEFLPPCFKELITLKDGLTTCLIGQQQIKLVLAKYIVCTLATFSQVVKMAKALARFWGLIGTTKKCVVRQILLSTQNYAFWLTYK
jgi:hypothetical protein